MPTYILTQADLVKTAARRWKEMNFYLEGPERKKIHQQLLKAKTAEEVDSIIGNKEWTTFYCHNCNAQHLKVVAQVGQEWDYETRTCNLCLDCVRSIHATLLAASAGQEEATEDINRGHGPDEVQKPALSETNPQDSP